MLTLQSLSKSFGARTVLDDVTWRIPKGKTIGLVGPNGAGKTTLLRIITGEIEADHGDVIAPKGVHVGFLPQEINEAEKVGSLMDTILLGRRDLLEMEERLAALEHQLSGNPELAEEYGDLRDQFDQMGGYILRSTAREIAVGMGFSPNDFDRPIEEFSGGWQMRALLVRLLFKRPDVLLLDEPTNHLDLETVEWLERFLRRYEGSVLMVSHDRMFLNALVDEIIELERGELTAYPGTYDAYRAAKAERRAELEKLAAQQEREIQKVERFVERFRSKATKATQVQSRVKELEKMERVVRMADERASMNLKFPQPERLGKQVVRIEAVSKRFDDNVVYQDLSLIIARGDKVALVGPNGAGKTTLLKMMAGRLNPDQGVVELGHNVRISYFAQHALEDLDPNATVVEEMMSSASVEGSGRVRDLLGAFLFSGDDVQKQIRVLSGGEKSRLVLAKLLLDPGGLLLLDEPTNHLDIPSRQVLEEALRQFQGGVVLVSHDRFFINEVVNRVVHVEDGAGIDYIGNYDYYRWKRDQELAEKTPSDHDTDAPPKSLTKKEIRQAMAELRKRKADAMGDRTKTLSKLETRIVEIEDRMNGVHEELADPAVYGDPERARGLNVEYKKLEQELEQTMEDWELLGVEIDAIEVEFRVEEDALTD